MLHIPVLLIMTVDVFVSEEQLVIIGMDCDRLAFIYKIDVKLLKSLVTGSFFRRTAVETLSVITMLLQLVLQLLASLWGPK